MYKVLIVDDEKLIRQGMEKAIPWKSIGVGEGLTAKSGKEALQIIKTQRPEIMITDIRMDEMTGLDLIDAAKKIEPEIRLLVLTGYNDFEYARQCIKLKVHDFFLKPVDERVLVEAVEKQIACLEDKTTTRAHAVAEQMSIESFMKDLVHNRLDQQNEIIGNFCKRYNFNEQQHMQVAIVMPSLNMKPDSKSIFLAIKNICMKVVDANNRGLTFADDHGRIVIACFLHMQKKNKPEWLRELEGILTQNFGKKLKIILGNPVVGLHLLHISYSGAVYLLDYEYDGLHDIVQSGGRQEKASYRDVFLLMVKDLCENIDDTEKALSVFEQFSKAIKVYNLSDSYIRRCCFELASTVYYVYLCDSEREADTRISTLMNNITNVNGEETLELTRQFLIQLLENREGRNIHEIVRKAKCYISEHLADELSVSDIAAHLYVTPSYLSRLFKKVSGEGCNEYIVRKRIGKAKLLLETTNLKICKIAKLVGYNDSNYFSLTIKKMTGMSPKEYREELQRSYQANQ